MGKIAIGPLFLLPAFLVFGCQTMGMSSGKGIEGTAFHEAGHAFMACEYGVFVSAELLPDGRSGEFGRCWINAGQATGMQNIEIRLAGIIAKLLFAGSGYGAYCDLRSAAELAENLAASGQCGDAAKDSTAEKKLKSLFFSNFLAGTWISLSPGAKNLLSQACRRVEEMLTKNEATVRAMSSILLSRKKLDKKDLEALAP